MVGAEPLSAAEFDAVMAALAPFSRHGIAIAVSGGPDSMALAICTKQWTAEQNIPLQAFIVNHALRDASSHEAETTQKQLQMLGIPAAILRWEHGPVLSKLHVTARKARYRLLLDACRAHNITDLLLAHQQEDQAETILMRFAKGSGIDGLAGIASQSHMEDIRLLRPLLSFPKARLIATCEAPNISYVIDPSNQSDKFARGRLRRVMPLLAAEGLTQERLCDLGARAAEASDALNYYTNEFLQNAVVQDETGTIRMDLLALQKLPRAVANRAIAHTLQSIHRQDYAPEYMSLTSLLDAIFNDTAMTPRTLHGCLASQTSTQLILMREFAAITDAPSIQPGETVLWDGRWYVHLEADADQTYKIRPLGNPPHEMLDQLAPGLRQKFPQGRARASLPALWTGENNAENLALIPSLTRSSGPNQSYAQALAMPRISQ